MLESIADVYQLVGARRTPEFILPARFRAASFTSFEVSDAHPEHAHVIGRVEAFVHRARPRRTRFWERNGGAAGDGLFLVGPPGVGKTHLLAAGFVAAAAPKLFATFDELVAAAGPLGMRALTEAVCAPSLVCVDEIVLEDPGNITLLATLLQQMVESGTHVLATANMPPHEAGGEGGWIQSFARELGAIASVFDVVRIAGPDRRASLPQPDSASGQTGQRTLEVSWAELQRYLLQTHPMHDAGWLASIDRLRVTTPIEIPQDKDQALRFVRFIDRVYDRAVGVSVAGRPPAPEQLVGPLVGDRRFVWHVARGTSRLRALLGQPQPAAVDDVSR